MTATLRMTATRFSSKRIVTSGCPTGHAYPCLATGANGNGKKGTPGPIPGFRNVIPAAFKKLAKSLENEATPLGQPSGTEVRGKSSKNCDLQFRLSQPRRRWPLGTLSPRAPQESHVTAMRGACGQKTIRTVRSLALTAGIVFTVRSLATYEPPCASMRTENDPHGPVARA